MNGKPGNAGRRIIIFAIAITVVAGIVYPALAAPPSQGAVIEGAKPPAAVRQPAETKEPAITVEGGQPQTQADGQQKIPVRGFRIGGEPPLAADKLLSLVRGEAGKELSLGELNALAGRLTKHMRQQGYLVAFAYIPAQDIRDGMVEIA
ncbi:MAG: POTRA domain-containing protein, partial [Sporomusaceae bacterium]|nr:POTRA domain-containing protein [Sporomusaceae bacterium]